jgi:hypothetical protein
MAYDTSRSVKSVGEKGEFLSLPPAPDIFLFDTILMGKPEGKR